MLIFDLIAPRITFYFLLVPKLSESEGRNGPARGKGQRAPVGVPRRGQTTSAWMGRGRTGRVSALDALCSFRISYFPLH